MTKRHFLCHNCLISSHVINLYIDSVLVKWLQFLFICEDIAIRRHLWETAVDTQYNACNEMRVLSSSDGTSSDAA